MALRQTGAHPAAPMQIIGRRGSLFTRVALIFAEELGIPFELVEVERLTALDPAIYGGNPALKMPALRRSGGDVLFGAQNACRAIAEAAAAPARIIWPEELRADVARNAQELVWHCMAAQVQLVIGTHVAKLPQQSIFFVKARSSLEASLRWLDVRAADALATLPKERTLSVLEVSLFCLVEHLVFRPTVPMEQYEFLLRFARDFGTRRSAERTPYT